MRGDLYWDDDLGRNQKVFVVGRRNLGRLKDAVLADLFDCDSKEGRRHWEGLSVLVTIEMHLWQAKRRRCSCMGSQMSDDSSSVGKEGDSWPLDDSKRPGISA